MAKTWHEFKKGEIVHKIGSPGMWYVYGVDDGFYYITEVGTGVPYGFDKDWVEGNFVSGYDSMDEDCALELSRLLEVGKTRGGFVDEEDEEDEEDEYEDA